MGPYPACHRLWGSVSVLMDGTPCGHCLMFPCVRPEYRAAGNVEHQLDERPGSSLCAGQQPRWTSWCSSFPGPCPVVLPSWERRAPARWAAWLKPLCWPAASLDELVLVLPRPVPGRASLLGTSSTSSMGGLVQASVLASSLAGRAGARPSQGNARLRHPRNRLSEAQQRTGEHHCADQRQGQEGFPHGFDAGATVENGLTELDEMGGGGGEHDVLHQLGHAFPRCRTARKQLQRNDGQHHQHAELWHVARQGGEEDAHRGGSEQTERGAGKEQRQRTLHRHPENTAHHQMQ